MGYWRSDGVKYANMAFNNVFNEEERKKYKKYLDRDLKDTHSDMGMYYGKFWEKGIDANAHMKNIAKRWDAEIATQYEGGPVAESTIKAESTQQANLRAQQTGTPDANNQESESQKDTETKRRQNKAKGKRGFVVARESGQGINI